MVASFHLILLTERRVILVGRVTPASSLGLLLRLPERYFLLDLMTVSARSKDKVLRRCSTTLIRAILSKNHLKKAQLPLLLDRNPNLFQLQMTELSL